jgi:signal transduction histidine kinase
MRHILINILSNAIKYSPNSKPVEFKISKSKRFIEFYVHDFGVGIPQKDLDKVFDPFFRATNSEDFSGTGLGMTIVKQSVDTHGGTIDIKSTEGKGTEVKILIPFRPM